MFRPILVAISMTILGSCSTVPEPACPQPPTSLLLPPPSLESLQPPPLTEQAAVEAWLGDVERYWIIRRRFEALQGWGQKYCWGPQLP